MNAPSVSSMQERRYESIALNHIKVINSRLRDEEQFQMNTESIKQTGLMMPIRVNDKFLEKTGKYELVCGEGRLLAHRRMGKNVIKAEVVTCTRKEAYLQSLIENIARSRPGTMEFAHELKRLHDDGWDYKQIARIACRSPEYIRQYIRLIEKGESRLIAGVEQGVFSISFAVLVAQSDDANIQNVLMDAFDQGIVNASNFSQAKRLLNGRLRGGRGSNGNAKKRDADYTVSTLKKDIANVTKKKGAFVREAEFKENRFLVLLTGINGLWHDKRFLELVHDEDLADRPALMGDYSYEDAVR